MPTDVNEIIKSGVKRYIEEYYMDVDESRKNAEYIFRELKKFLETDNKRFRLFADDVTVVLEPDLILDTAYVYLDKQGKRLFIDGLFVFFKSGHHGRTDMFASGKLQIMRPYMEEDILHKLQEHLSELVDEGVRESYLYQMPSSYSELKNFLSDQDLQKMREEFSFEDDTDEEEHTQNYSLEISEWLYDTDSYRAWYESQWQDEVAIAINEALFQDLITNEISSDLLPFLHSDEGCLTYSQLASARALDTPFEISGEVLKGKYKETTTMSPLENLKIYIDIKAGEYGEIFHSFPILVEQCLQLKDFLSDDPLLEFDLNIHTSKQNEHVTFGNLVDFYIDRAPNATFLKMLGLNSSSNFSSTSIKFST